jgi:capsular polysaccharide transport system ATP-binding protein
MVIVEDLWKSYPTRNGLRTILRDVNFTVNPGERLGILGRNGAGKSTMIRLIGGVEMPSKGKVRRQMSVSWPLAFGGAFQMALTGADNVRLISRIYGVDAEGRVEAVDDFAELGAYMREPLATYSSGMLARLAFGVSMAVEFDCFLIDETIAVGDKRFSDKCDYELFQKRADRAMICVSHNGHWMRTHCQKAGVLSDGSLTMFDDVNEAYKFYHDTLKD